MIISKIIRLGSCLSLVLFHLIGSSQNLDQKYCDNLIQNYADEDLFNYLEKLQDDLAQEDLVLKSYYYGKYYRFKNEKELQIKSLYEALELCLKNCSPLISANIYDELAIALKDGGVLDREKSMFFIDKSIAIRRDLDSKNLLSKSLLIKGNCYYLEFGFLKEKNQNVDHLLDSSIYLQSQAFELSSDQKIQKKALMNLAIMNVDKANFKEAEELFNKIVEEYVLFPYELSLVYNNMSFMYMATKNYPAVERTIEKLQKCIEQNNLDQIEDVYYLKFTLASAKQNYKEALFYKERLDSIQHRNQDLANYEAQEKYNNAYLEAELSREEAKQLRSRLWVIALSAGLGGLALISLFIFRLLKFRRKEVENELEKTKIQSVLDATRAEMEGEQKERQIIASELHDQLASSLTAANIHLSIAQKGNNNISLNKAEDILKEVSSQVREISHKLVSPSLMKFGLTTGIESMIEQHETHKFGILFNSNFNGKRIEQAKENFLYRSCLELINNAKKYSNGNQIQIKLIESQANLSLSVEDNGSVILDVNKLNTGFGLSNIKNRALAFGGKFKFDGTSPESTVVELSIPI